jgi:hypothetical protein
MSKLTQLLNKHGSALGKCELEAVTELSRRLEARRSEAFPSDMSVVEAQSGFIMFEREFSGAPVDLFGQDVPSLAHTVIRIYRAVQSLKNAAFEPAAEIFVARISEKSLTEAMLQVSRGSKVAPVTITRLGDFDLPPFVSAGSAVDIGGAIYRAEADATDQDLFAELRRLIDTEPRRSNSDLKGAVKHLSRRAADAKDISFELSRHLESMSVLRNEVLTEASYAALHAQKVMQALGSDTLKLSAPGTPDWDAIASRHPLVEAALDQLSPGMRDGIGKLIIAEMRALATTYPKLLQWITVENGVEVVNFPASRDRHIALPSEAYGTGVSQHIEALSNLWNHAFNPNIAEERTRLRANQGALTVGRREGSTSHLHSTLPASDEGYFSLSFVSAYDEYRYGVRRVEGMHRPLIEIEITGQDLMTALRGHPDGLPIPCSFRSIAGHWQSAAARPESQIDADIAASAAELDKSPEAQHLRSVLAVLSDLAESKRTGKAWQDEMLAALDDVEEALSIFKDRSEQISITGKSNLNAHVAKSAETMLRSISRSLPNNLLEMLSLPKS